MGVGGMSASIPIKEEPAWQPLFCTSFSYSARAKLGDRIIIPEYLGTLKLAMFLSGFMKIISPELVYSPYPTIMGLYQFPRFLFLPTPMSVLTWIYLLCSLFQLPAASFIFPLWVQYPGTKD